jgi:hypothetical protein
MTTSRWHIFNIFHKDAKQLNDVGNVIRSTLQSLGAERPLLIREYTDDPHLRIGTLSPSSTVKDEFLSFLRKLQDRREIDRFSPVSSDEHQEVDHVTELGLECSEIHSELFGTVSKIAYFFHNYLNQDGALYIDQIHKEANRFLERDPKRYAKVLDYLTELNHKSRLFAHIWQSASGVV